jgi:hypothetical protein
MSRGSRKFVRNRTSAIAPTIPIPNTRFVPIVSIINAVTTLLITSVCT